MISNINTISSVVKMTDRSVVATCPLGSSFQGTGLPGFAAVRPAASLFADLPVRERNERPTKAPAAVAAAEAHAYALVAGAGSQNQTTTQHMWAFRGLEPWSDPA